MDIAVCRDGNNVDSDRGGKMKYTVRYAHLKEAPELKEGDSVSRGDKIGTMGSTGQSKFNHLHMDCVKGFVDKLIRLSEIGYGKEGYTPDIIQLNYFVDSELFNFEPVITTYFYEPGYKTTYGKNHPGYDIVPGDRHKTADHFSIYWNRSKIGTVLKTGYDAVGYGNYILIGFEA